MEVSGVSSAVGKSNAFAELDTGEFIEILITELQNQDPLDPQDSAALLEQLSSIRSIESQTSLNDELKSLVGQNQVAVAGNLIGKMVQGIDTFNTNTSGLVTSVRVTNEGVLLELDNGRAISMDQVTNISESSAAGVSQVGAG